ncbi:MAG: putative glycosyl transferase, group 1, partial [Verrucomicrobiaceae bacterium]|nr:putative glycosyl transferase, group 1 [Verrucomicrobiaceae bacterium]
MKILIISTCDIGGGAAIAAYRLHRGLLAAGVHSRMLVKDKLSDDDTVVRFEAEAGGNDWLLSLNLHVTTKARAGGNNTTFSLPWPGESIAAHPLVQEAEVINLHWVSQFMGPESVRGLLSLGKPVVWTLHDQRPFTGGCHYTAGCEGFLTNCQTCPQLQPDYQAIPEQALSLSDEALKDLPPLTVVTPSRWLGNEAKRSRLFSRYPIKVIPNGIDLEVFKPGNREAARTELGLPVDALILMFGAFTLGERRKGFD